MPRCFRNTVGRRWSQRLSAQLGLLAHHPAFVIEHQYAITEPIEQLRALRAGEGASGSLQRLRVVCRLVSGE